MDSFFVFSSLQLVDEADKEALSMFMQPTQKTRTIADMIAEKLIQIETGAPAPDSEQPVQRLHPKVIQVYRR